MKRVVINIRASKNISGLVKFSVTSPAGLMKFFLNVEPCNLINFWSTIAMGHIKMEVFFCSARQALFQMNLHAYLRAWFSRCSYHERIYCGFTKDCVE